MDNYFVQSLKKKVLQAGGEYIGIQKDDLTPYVMYNDPVTHSTLMIETYLATVENIRNSMLKKRLWFSKCNAHKNGGFMEHLCNFIYSIKACSSLIKKIIVLLFLIIGSIVLIFCI